MSRSTGPAGRHELAAGYLLKPDLVADAIAADQFWVIADPQFTRVALDRWQRIAGGRDPQIEVDVPGFPPGKQIVAEIQRLLTGQGDGLQPTRSSLAYASEPSSQASCA